MAKKKDTKKKVDKTKPRPQPTTDPKKLEETIEQLCKQHGKGAIMRLTGAAISADIPVISTGSMQLDRCLGVYGLARGRIVEVYGNEGGGKTTLTLHAIAECQKAGGVCAFIDAEHALDPSYAQAIGVKVEDLLISQPDHGEQALAITDGLARSGTVALIVIDSVAALIPKAELEGEMGDHHLGLQARLMSQAMRKLASVASQSNTLIIFINQIRHKIGVLFGSPETTSGGNALKFYASVRLDVRRTSVKTKNALDQVTGGEMKVRVIKNKLAPPFRECLLKITFGKGIDRGADILELAMGLGVVEKSGAWFSFGDDRLSQGFNNSAANITEDEELQQRIVAEIESVEKSMT